MGKFIEYFRLTKVHSAGLTGFVPILGALYFSQDLLLFFGLFIMGILSHIHIFTMNEYLDLKIDRQHDHMGGKPLIKGSINAKNAKILSITFFILTYIFFITYFSLINFYFDLNLNIILPLLIYSTSVGLHMLYNFIGKRIIGKDFLLASGHFFLCLFGSSMVLTNWEQLPMAILPALYFFIELTITTDLADLKDIENEKKMKCKTPPILLGVKVRSNSIIYSSLFEGYVFFLRGILIITVITFLFLGDVEFSMNNYILILVIILFTICSILILNSIFKEKVYNRRSIIIKLGINEIFTFETIPLMILLIMDIGFYSKFIIFMAILIIPFLWLVILLKISYDDIVPIT